MRFNLLSSIGMGKFAAVLVLVGSFVLIFPVGFALADSNELYKQADKAIRDSQRAMFNGKLEESQSLLRGAEELIGQIKASDPGFSKLKTLESKYGKQAKDLEKRLPKPSSASAPSSETAASTSSADSAKLPGGVTHRLKKIDNIIKGADRVLNKDSAASDDWRVKELDSIVKQAQDMMNEIRSGYGDQIPPNHPEMTAREEKIEDFEKKVADFKKGVSADKEAAARGEAEKELRSNEWLAKLKPFVTGPYKDGYDENKYLVAGAVEDSEELARRKKIYDEASGVFAEYRKTEFPDGKTGELELVERDLEYSLNSFSESYSSMSDGFFQEAERRIEEAAAWQRNEMAGDDGKSQPKLLQKSIVPEIEGLIASAEASAPGDPRIGSMKERLADIESKDAEMRKLRAERTLMTPDKFRGSELKDIKRKAAEALEKDHPGAKVLRTTVISEDWKEERVWEHTDTTKTAVQYRVTRSVVAQIAGKTGDAVSLYTLYVGKDKLSDGSWGALKSHVMFVDPMLEKNVDK